MKKTLSIILALMLVTIAATAALAFRNNGEFYGDNVANPLRFSPNFAPNDGAVVSLGRKGVTTLTLDSYAAYKFWFTKTSDGTSDTCQVWFGTVTTWGATGGIPTAGEGPWHPGQGLKTVTFGCNSSATAHNLNYFKQVKK